MNEILVNWAVSDHGSEIFKRMKRDFLVAQSKEQLVLNLAAMLCYQRLLPRIATTQQQFNGSYHAEFHAIINGKRFSNTQAVFENMAKSALKVFCIVEDDEILRTFLTSALDKQLPCVDLTSRPLDSYWTLRMVHGHSHEDTLTMTSPIEVNNKSVIEETPGVTKEKPS